MIFLQMPSILSTSGPAVIFAWRLVLWPSQEDVIRGTEFQAVAWTRGREGRVTPEYGPKPFQNK